MIWSNTTRIVIALFVGFLVAAGLVYVLRTPEEPAPTPAEPNEATSTPVAVSPVTVRTIGASVEKRPIELYSFGTGTTSLLFVGGMHGGYEWNSILLAYVFIDYLQAAPENIPSNLTIHIIPNLNPDGLYKVIGKEGRFLATDVPGSVPTAPGRFNANSVDLNRNFDCKWKPESMWRGETVSAGDAPFSEPEAQTLRSAVTELAPSGVVFWHSKANAVYASECLSGILPETRVLMDTYAGGAQYKKVDVFDAYPVTGDAEGWLASIGIPAITVELESRESIEWDRNLAGFTAVIDHYSTAK